MSCLQICVCCWHWALKTPVVFHHPGAPQHMQPEFCLCVHGCCCHVCFRSKPLLTVLLPGNTLIPCKHALSLKLPLQAQGLQQLCHCQNPYIDIDDGAGTTTAFANHPFQKLSSNIGKFGTFGLIHIAGPSTQVSIHDCCCRGANSFCRDANSCCSAAWQSNEFDGIII